VFLFVSNVLKVRALLRFADETALEVTTAAKLRAGSQRDGSRPAPFHTALLVRELFVREREREREGGELRPCLLAQPRRRAACFM
jgi:hypothetical protein